MRISYLLTRTNLLLISVSSSVTTKITKPIAEVNRRCVEGGLLVIQAEGNVLRFVPPLIVEEKHIDEMIGKLKQALAD